MSYGKSIIVHVKFFMKTEIPLMFVSSKQVMLKICNFYELPSKTLFIFTLIREEDKNIFDYCRENNIDHITKVIKSKNMDVNMKDEEVWKTCLVNYFFMPAVLPQCFFSKWLMNYNSKYSVRLYQNTYVR